MSRAVDSTRNPAVMAAAALHRRKGRLEQRATILEGPNLVASALDAGMVLSTIFVLEGDDEGHTLAERSTVRSFQVTERVLQKLSSTRTPQSPVAVMPLPEEKPTSGGRVLVAWDIADPGNCGALLRVAAAFGYGFVAGPGTTDAWSPKVMRAGAGGHFATTVEHAPDLAAVRRGGRVVIATVAGGGDAPGPLPADTAVLIGNEAHGLPSDIAAAADVRVSIPMRPGVESLNAAVAGALVAYIGAGGPGTNLRAR